MTADVRSRAIAVFLLLVLFMVACSRTVGPDRPATGDSEGRLLVGGLNRTYLLHVPANLGSAPVPLVVAFHGRDGTGKGMEDLTGFSRLADERRFIVVYPDGIGRSWNNGSGVGMANERNVDDVGFVGQLLDRLHSEFPVDRLRVYGVGMSNGAMFVQRLACELSDRFAAVATVAGSMAPSVAASCRPARPIAILQIHGTADEFVPIAGGNTKGGGQVQSATETILGWVLRDSCQPDPMRATPAIGVNCERFAGCTDDTAAELCRVVNGGHTWPGSMNNPPPVVVGPTNAVFDATRYISRFLLGHPGA